MCNEMFLQTTDGLFLSVVVLFLEKYSLRETLTSVFCQQEEVALQHWSPARVLVEELGKSHGEKREWASECVGL